MKGFPKGRLPVRSSAFEVVLAPTLAVTGTLDALRNAILVAAARRLPTCWIRRASRCVAPSAAVARLCWDNGSADAGAQEAVDVTPAAADRRVHVAHRVPGLAVAHDLVGRSPLGLASLTRTVWQYQRAWALSGLLPTLTVVPDQAPSFHPVQCQIEQTLAACPIRALYPAQLRSLTVNHGQPFSLHARKRRSQSLSVLVFQAGHASSILAAAAA
jgi:hypothetical protein